MHPNRAGPLHSIHRQSPEEAEAAALIAEYQAEYRRANGHEDEHIKQSGSSIRINGNIASKEMVKRHIVKIKAMPTDPSEVGKAQWTKDAAGNLVRQVEMSKEDIAKLTNEQAEKAVDENRANINDLTNEQQHYVLKRAADTIHGAGAEEGDPGERHSSGGG